MVILNILSNTFKNMSPITSFKPKDIYLTNYLCSDNKIEFIFFHAKMKVDTRVTLQFTTVKKIRRRMQNMMGIRTQIAEVNTVLTKPNRFPRQSSCRWKVCKYLNKAAERQAFYQLSLIMFHLITTRLNKGMQVILLSLKFKNSNYTL